MDDTVQHHSTITMEPLIEIKDLHFEYSNGKKVFNGLNFLLHRGQRIGLIGPNGSGKTTLLHIIMGLLRPSRGTIKIFGRHRTRESDFREVRKKIGLLFQDSDDQLFCPTVEEDIAFGPLNLGVPPAEASRIVEETCAALGLSEFKSEATHRLSGGEKRLVALATVFAMKPECYLLDEPTTGLDQETTERIIAFLRQHAETYLLITHDREVLKKTVDRVYRIHQGKLFEV